MLSKLPKLMRAARRASAGDIPRERFCSVSSSTWSRSSSSLSLMTDSRPKSARRRAEITLNHLSAVRPLRRLPHLGDGEDEAIPTRLLGLQLAPTRLRQRVELSVPARLVRLPLR